MKKLYNILFLSAFAIFMSIQSQAQSMDNVKSAIKIGSSKELSTYFDSNVEITVDGKTSNYSKAQSEFVMKDFFKKNPAKGFEIMHNGTSEGGLMYLIGTFESNESFRVLIRMKENKIYNLSFTKE